MDHIVVEGVEGYDGRYPFNIADSGFTTREWGWIKRLTGYLPLTMDDGIEGGDPELFCCFAAIALRRDGRINTDQFTDAYGRLSDGEFGTSIRLELGDRQEREEMPDDPTGSLNGNTSSAGPGSPPSSEKSDSHQKPSGTPGSATSGLVSATWET